MESIVDALNSYAYYRDLFDAGKVAYEEVVEAYNKYQSLQSNKRQRTSMMRKINPGGSGGMNIPDPQFVSQVRNARSKYGRRRRHNLKNAWYELDKNRTYYDWTWQTFKNNGFQSATGPITACYNRSSEGASAVLPAMAFRLSAFPGANVARNNVAYPELAYRLLQENPNVTSGTSFYKWERISSGEVQNNPQGGVHYNNPLVTKITGQETGLLENLQGFRHHWSRCDMTFYPQNNIPTKWHIYLCKWKADNNSWPESECRTNTGALVTEHFHPDEGTRNSVLADQWTSYWQGKILHPNNKESRQSNQSGKLPFNILKHDIIDVPARNSNDQIRVLHRLFFRNDRQYKTGKNLALDARAYNNQNGTFNVRVDEDANTFGLFPDPLDQVWLLITCECFTTTDFISLGNIPTNGSVPTFDIKIRAKCSVLESDRRENSGLNLPGRDDLAFVATGPQTGAVEPVVQQAVDEGAEGTPPTPPTP